MSPSRNVDLPTADDDDESSGEVELLPVLWSACAVRYSPRAMTPALASTLAIERGPVIVAPITGVMQGNIWSVLRQPEPLIPMLFPSHFSSP